MTPAVRPRLVAAVLLGLWLFPTPLPAAVVPPNPADRLVRTEYAFAAVTQARGIKDGFLQFLAADGVLFRGGPVPGREWLENHPPTPGRLVWAPEFAELSASGDLGWTVGPWEYTVEPETATAPDVFGHFVSVWQAQADGSLKVLVDIGIDHAGAGPLPRRTATQGPVKLPKKPNSSPPRRQLRTLQSAEGDFTGKLDTEGEPTAFRRWLDPRGRILRPGRMPMAPAELPLLQSALPTVLVEPVDRSQRLHLSLAGDLGVVWGEGRVRPPDGTTSGPHRGFLRIWRHQSNKGWRIVLDAAVDYPPPGARE